MLILSHDEVLGLLKPMELVAAVEAALRAQLTNRVVMPQRLHIDWDDNTLLTMPAVGAGCCGIKLVCVIPGNAARGYPVTSGVMILNDAMTGVPLSVMNAAALTAQRTGAVGALGVKYLAPATTTSVGLIGCGTQGTRQAIFACAVRPIREIFCFSRSIGTLESFRETVRRHAAGVEVTFCADAADVVKRTQVVIAATTSAQPVLPDDPAILRDKLFISIGSYKPTMQELPDSVYRLAGSLAVDSLHACHEAGDVINALERRILDRDDVYSIGEVVMGQRAPKSDGTRVYKTVGAAFFDLFVAQAAYEAAKSRGVGLEVAV